MSVRTRIIRSLYATGFGQIVTLLTQLAGVPLFLHFWGVEEYGEWLILSALPAYLVMSDFGFASVAANDMTMTVAQGRKDDALKTFHSTFIVILAAGGLSGLAAAALVLLQSRFAFLPVTTVSESEVAVVIVLFWGQVGVALLGGLVGAGYRCDGNFAAGSFLNNLLRLCEFAASVVALLVGGGFAVVALSVLLTRLAGVFAIAAGLRKRSPWLSFGIKGASREEIRRLIRPALAFMAFPVGNAISIQGFVLVVGWVAGAPSVALWSTYRTMTRFPYQMMGMITASVWPELSMALGAGNVATARKLHRFAVSSSTWLVLAALTVLLVLGEPLLRVWTGGQIPFERDLFFILCGVVLANSLWSTSAIVPISVNQHQSIAVAYLLSTSASMVLALGLGEVAGLQGIAGSLLVVDATMSYFVLRKSTRLTCDTMPAFARWCAGAPRRAMVLALRRQL